MKSSAILLIAASLLSGRAVSAQEARAPSRIEIGGVAGYVTADGADFNGTDAAFGWGGGVRYVLLGRVGLGAGIHYSDHGLQSFPEHLHIRAVYGEARYFVQLGGAPVTAFGGLRFGWVHEDITIVNWTAKGSVAGGLVGLDWRFASPLALELQISETAIRLGDRRAANGSVMSGTAVRGSALGLQGGLLITF